MATMISMMAAMLTVLTIATLMIVTTSGTAEVTPATDQHGKRLATGMSPMQEMAAMQGMIADTTMDAAMVVAMAGHVQIRMLAMAIAMAIVGERREMQGTTAMKAATVRVLLRWTLSSLLAGMADDMIHPLLTHSYSIRTQQSSARLNS